MNPFVWLAWWGAHYNAYIARAMRDIARDLEREFFVKDRVVGCHFHWKQGDKCDGHRADCRDTIEELTR